MAIGAEVSFSLQRLELKYIIDPKTFRPCHAKEVEEFSYKKMKREKWIVHVSRDGTITKEKLSGQ